MLKLNNLRKVELIELASEFGVDTDGRKIDIESRITNFLILNRDIFQKDIRFRPFYEEIDAPAFTNTPSNRNKRRSTLVNNFVSSSPSSPYSVAVSSLSERAYSPKRRPLSTISSYGTRSSTLVSPQRHTENQNEQEQTKIDNQISNQSSKNEIFNLNSSTPMDSLKNIFNFHNFLNPLNNFKIQSLKIFSFNKTINSIKKKSSYASLEVHSISQETRNKISNLFFFHMISIIYEYVLLISTLLPWRFKSIPLEFNSAHLPTFDFNFNFNFNFNLPFYFPDISYLKNIIFWQSLSLWFSVSLLVPLIVSYFFNLTRSGDYFRYTLDPLTFSTTKLLFSYLFYFRATRQTYNYNLFSAGLNIQNILGDTPYIASILGIIFSLYAGQSY